MFARLYRKSPEEESLRYQADYSGGFYCLKCRRTILPQLTALQLFSQFEKLRKVYRFICVEEHPPKKSRGGYHEH